MAWGRGGFVHASQEAGVDRDAVSDERLEELGTRLGRRPLSGGHRVPGLQRGRAAGGRRHHE